MHTDIEYEDSFEGPSKSELKRQQTAIQDLIGELIALPKNALQSSLDTLQLEGDCLQEILVAAGMSPSSARNRQIRYVTKLVSKESGLVENIQGILEKTKEAKQQNASQLHEAEYWREKILTGEDSDIFDFSNKFAGTDQQQLRQLRREFLKFSKMENLSSKQQASAELKQKEIRRKVFKIVSENIRNNLD
jgi:ribosome-associated protein